MSDRLSWPNGAPPEELADMLGVARAEQPGAHVFDRTMAAFAAAAMAGATGLGAGAKAAAASPGALQASAAVAPAAAGSVVVKGGTLTLVALTQWGTAGFLAGTLIVGASTLPSRDATNATRSQPSTSSSSGAEAPVAAKPGASAVLEAPLPAASPEPDPVSARSTTLPREAPVARAAAPMSDPSSNDPRFRRELQLVDEARSALGLGQPAEVLRLHGRYQREFGASGHFAPEMLYLRLEAHSKSGNRGGAEEAAREILERYPNGPHALRARAELESQKP